MNAIESYSRHWTSPPTTQLVNARTSLHGFDYTRAMIALCKDIALRVPVLAAVDMSRVLVTATINRKATKYGLQARVTPMRFQDGALTTRRRGGLYGIQRYFVNDIEMLYLLTFVMPRFLNQPFGEKLTTVIHELYHMSPAFDGDFRRLGGRCNVHSHSKKIYDAEMERLATAYQKEHPDPNVYAFLNHNFDHYQQTHGGVRLIVVPRPRLVPISKRV